MRGLLSVALGDMTQFLCHDESRALVLTCPRAKQLAVTKLGAEQNLLIVSWIGDKQDGPGFSLVLCDGVAMQRDTVPRVDKGGYWYATLGAPWAVVAPVDH